MRGKILILLLFLGASGSPHAQSVRYVTDVLRLEARSGPATSFKIVQMLSSGSSVTVLDTQDGYSKVRTSRGREAWILSRYLQTEPVAREQLGDATEELTALREAQATFSDTLAKAREVGQQAETMLRQATDENQGLREELETIKQAAASTLATQQENKRLSSELGTIRAELEALGTETRALREGRQREWFLAGAAVLGVGIVLGLVIPRIGRRRRRSWSDF